MIKYEVAKGFIPSPAEKKLANKLIEYGCIFEQEVMFDGCIHPLTGNKLRFDFYIPSKGILIEYDGIGYHEDAEAKYKDKIKTAFAKSVGLTLYRVTGTYNFKHLLEERIGVKLSDVKPSKLYSEFNRLRDLENRKKYYKGKTKAKRNIGNKCKRRK